MSRAMRDAWEVIASAERGILGGAVEVLVALDAGELPRRVAGEVDADFEGVVAVEAQSLKTIC